MSSDLFAVKTHSQRPQPKLHKYRPGRPGGAGKIRNHHIIHRRVEYRSLDINADIIEKHGEDLFAEWGEKCSYNYSKI